MLDILITFFLSASLFAAGWLKTYKQLQAKRADYTAALEEITANDLAWEKGQDDLQELYSMQMLTLEERLEEASETAVELFTVFQEQEDVIALLSHTTNEMDKTVQFHEKNCLPHLDGS